MSVSYKAEWYWMFSCLSTGGAGQSCVVGPGGGGSAPKVPLCSGLHSTQMHRDQHNQRRCEGQSEGQEGASPQSHRAASSSGEGKSRTWNLSSRCDAVHIVKILLLSPGFKMGGWWDIPAGISTSRQVFITRGSRISPSGAGGIPE